VLGPAAAIPFIVLLGFEPRPDVLIADTTQAVAVRDGDGLSLVSGRAGSFATEVWGQHYQTPIEQDHRSERCDSLGCIVSLPEFSVAVVRNAAAFAEDCGAHELLVTRIDPPQWCRSEGLVIGPDELERGGVQWLHWNQDAGRFDVRPAIDHLNRPWRVLPR
jgi:competence protein ComEC